MKRIALALAATLLAAPVTVFADNQDTLNVTLSETRITDDNVFRLPDGVTPAAGNGQRSDRISLDSAAVSFDKAFSLQKFHVDANLIRYRYDTYDYLNFTARNGAARWNWALTPRLTGQLAVTQKQSLNSFADFRNTAVRNSKTDTTRNADLDFWFHGGWHLVAGVARNKSSNTVSFLDANDTESRSGQAGFRYLAKDGDYLTYQLRHARGNYSNATPVLATLSESAYRQTDHEVLWRWSMSGRSVLQGRVTKLEREHRTFAVRDYSGTAGKLDYTLTPTGKTQIQLSMARDLGSYQAANANYSVTDTLSLAPTWQMTTKTQLRLKFDRSDKDYLGNPGLATGSRTDRQRTALLGVDWAPYRAVSLGASVQRDSRRSTAAGLDYDDETATLTAQLSF